MTEMVCSALAQETVSRGVSFVLGKCEEKTSQGHLMERLEMAISELEFSLDRAKELPIRHVSLLDRRKMIKRAYVEALELLDKHKQQAVPAGQEEIPRGAKRKRWIICARNMFLSTGAVRRFELYADCAGRFVRDMESGCSLHHYTFCKPIVRHLLEGKTLSYYHLEQGKLLQDLFIWPVYSDERGVEAMLKYHCESSTITEKNFCMLLFLRLSESSDIVGVAIKGLQLLTSEFNLSTKFAMGELTLLSNLQDITHSYGTPRVGFQEEYMIDAPQNFRPNSTCCKENRHRLCANNNVSSDLSGIFPEQVMCWAFECYYVPALEPSRSLCSSSDVLGRGKSRGGGQPPLLLTATFVPHGMIETQDSFVLATFGDDTEYIDGGSLQLVAEVLKSDEINCLFHESEVTEYTIQWHPKHGSAFFKAEKASMHGNNIGEPAVQHTMKEAKGEVAGAT